nr:tellurite resistance TerB family protein [Desulfovibrio sp.]
GAGGMARNVALVGAGLAAWSFFKKWSAQRQQEGAYAGAGAGAGTNPFSADFQASTGDPTAQLVVRSLVYAARADGHIDEAEQVRIVDAMKQLFPGQDLQKLVNSLLREPVDAKALAAQVKSMEEAEDVYMMSCMAIDIDHPAERAYLDELAGSFGMPRDRQAAIEREAAEAKNRMAGAGL